MIAGESFRCARDPADGVFDLAVLVRPEIEDVGLVRGFAIAASMASMQSCTYRYDLRCLPFPSTCRARGPLKRVVEIEHVTVGVSLAEDGDEAEDVTLEAESLAIGMDESLGRQFGSAVERGLDRERSVLRRRETVARRIPIRSRRRRSASRRRAHGFEHVERADGVLVQILERMFQPEPDVGVRGQVETRSAPSMARARAGESSRSPVRDVSGETRSLPQKLLFARGEILEACNRVAVR